MGLLLALLPPSLGDECPTEVELKLKNNYPEFRQIDSTTMEVDWSHLWPDLNWEACVSSVAVVVDDVSVCLSDVGTKKLYVSDVESCKDLKVIVELELKHTPLLEYESGELKVQSFAVKGAKIFREPNPRDDAQNDVDVAYLDNDPTSIKISAEFSDLVDNPSCNKVVNVGLIVREMNAMVADTDVFAKNLGIFRRLEEIISGKLVDFCAKYEILARFDGTEGTGSTIEAVKYVGPVSDAALELAKSKGFRHDIKVTPLDLRVQVSYVLHYTLVSAYHFLGWWHSTEVGFVLPTHLPRVRFSAQLSQWTVSNKPI